QYQRTAQIGESRSFGQSVQQWWQHILAQMPDELRLRVEHFLASWTTRNDHALTTLGDWFFFGAKAILRVSADFFLQGAKQSGLLHGGTPRWCAEKTGLQFTSGRVARRLQLLQGSLYIAQS